MSSTRWLLVALLLLPSPARARPDRPDRIDRLSGAEAHFAAADRAFRSGRYSDALEELRASEAIDPRPEFLITFAQVYRALGRLDDAIDQCERYRASAPDGPLTARVQKLERELRRERELRAAPASDDDDDDDDTIAPARPPVTPPSPPPTPPPPRAPSLTAAPPPSRVSRRSVTLAVTLGVLGVVVGVAVGVGVGVGASDSPPATKLGPVRFP